jgi:hypothetical protein
MKAEIKSTNGAPALYVNGKPVFPNYLWSVPPSPGEWAAEDIAPHYAEAGIHFYTFDIGTKGKCAQWIGPGEGREGHFDFSNLKPSFERIISIDPKAKFHLRVHLEMVQWWCDLYPEECEIDSKGKRWYQSWASEKWRTSACEFLRALVNALKEAGLYERVIAYQTGAGATGEWVKGETTMGTLTGDFSKPMRTHFRAWLRNRYDSDEDKLRKSWNNGTVTFDTAKVPTGEEQFNAKDFTFRDTRQEMNVVDYYHCIAERHADCLISFNKTVKEATNGEALAGAFYGYMLAMGSNLSYHGVEKEASNLSYEQRSGHLGVEKAMNSPYVDFMVSPYAYGFRTIGGEGAPVTISDSLRTHGKLYIVEDDSRTHLRYGEKDYGMVFSLDDSLAVLKRNFSETLTRSAGIWWAGSSSYSAHIDPSKEPAFRGLLKQFHDIGEFSLTLDRSSSAEIAVLLDHESPMYRSIYNNLDMPLIYLQRLWGLPRLGAPADYFLLSDFIEGKLNSYKFFIFLNTFWADDERRRSITEKLNKSGATALWVYAPGYVGGGLEGMKALTGFSFDIGDFPWGVSMGILNFKHEITKRLPYDFFWGNSSSLGPLFHLNDPDAEVLGQVVYSRGRAHPGLAVKDMDGWKSIYCAVPNIPAPVLRGMAEYAGVHLYSEDGDVLYAAPNLFSVHTIAGGKRNFVLKQKAALVYDLFEKKEIGTDLREFNISLEPASTSLFYTGPHRDMPQ